MAEALLLEEIKASLATHARSATFTCGGSIPIEPATTYTDHPSSSGPIQVRFGSNGVGRTLSVPGSKVISQEFRELLRVSQPATFARAGEEVLDEEYRKAGKLDRGAFATDFCPYTLGIIDTLSQILLPQTKQSKHDRSIRAELYKFNVYSGPSGKFKPHVDTPRSEFQLGSLVVSLPFDHEGGQLAVRNAGSEVLFDWSKSANRGDAGPCIKWAAFYSDCEHEVHQVTAGHRITLTYNLQLSRSRHSSAKAGKYNNFLPDALKGADMSLYETAVALGLQCKLVPVIPDGHYGYDGKRDAFEQTFGPFESGEIHECDDSEMWGQPLPDSNLTWINPMKKDLKEVQAAYVVFGNELGNLDVKYSHAVMLIRIPRFRHRGLPNDETKSFWKGEDMPDPDEYAEGPDDYDSEMEEYEDDEESESSVDT
ncbi:unnamed protein product [Zymoseptoria tritici ST99CH_1A5]|uniref:Fe2OG dioxygenase domain-containing protein n=2 Tax=Zymoseptoria tritici TaxID=1047171 RepID=A0A2H1FZE1_ZYMTR|nr:unnamed protein product [Zymoseptoria tritici ST99CH_1E4]SMR47926.1 unnamed protein product [Zymoseptoria tritici ST99CH_3D1]SMY21832.1 unnamed protein product [Zymoseptoria tritici ST99CH_1A5]